MQHFVGHAAHQQGGKIGVATRPHHDQAGAVLVGGVQDEAGRGAVHGVAKVDAGSQPRSLQVLGVLLGELDRPSVPSRWPSGGTPDGAGARSRGRRRSHLHRPWRSWRPARPPSRWAWIRQPRAGWCRTSSAHLRGWLGWRQSPLAGTDLPGSLVCRPRTGRQRATALPGGRRTSVPAVSGRVKRRGGQPEGRLAINSVGNTCLVGKGSVR
jgi:hypothetical protein